MSSQYSTPLAGAAKAATEGELKGAAEAATRSELKGAAAAAARGERIGGNIPIGEKDPVRDKGDADYVPQPGEQATQARAPCGCIAATQCKLGCRLCIHA
jgi:hypothetical protein